MRSRPIVAFLFATSLGCLLAGCGGNNETPPSADPQEIALVRVEPTDGESAVRRNRSVRINFSNIILPGSVNDQSVRVRTGTAFQTRPQGSFVTSGNVVEFDPTVTEVGGSNSLGFPAGSQILVDVPLKISGDGKAKNLFVQNVEGNPITVASGDNIVTFSTGCTWDDPVPGPPGVIGLEFIPGPNNVGQVPANAAVTVVFSEPVDPETVLLSQNIFLTNNTPTSALYQQDIPSLVFYDGSLRRYTFQPVSGFGQGPFNILVNFIDPDDPATFDPARLPRDLGGNALQNFTFAGTFDTQFDANARTTGIIVENFVDQAFRDVALTDALWGNDTSVPFALVGAPITLRVENISVNRILNNGGLTDLPDVNGSPTLQPGPTNEGRYCSPANPLVGPDLLVTPNVDPPTTAGRRTMMLYRAAEIGGSGTIIRAAWGPLNDATTASSYQRVIIRMGHKRPNLNLTSLPFSSEYDVEPPVVLSDTRYQVGQSGDVNGDGVNETGWVDWPAFDNFFGYNGIDDLLLDIEATEGTASQFFRVFHAASQVAGQPACNCQRLFNATGACSLNNSIGMRVKDGVFGSDFINPTVVSNGLPNPAPTAYLMQFELAKTVSRGVSLYYDSGNDNPDYLAPLIAPLVQPCGAVLQIRWSGSMDGLVEDVPLTPDFDAIDGMRFVRFEATLYSNLFTGSRARVEILSLPFLPR